MSQDPRKNLRDRRRRRHKLWGPTVICDQLIKADVIKARRGPRGDSKEIREIRELKKLANFAIIPASKMMNRSREG